MYIYIMYIYIFICIYIYIYIYRHKMHIYRHQNIYTYCAKAYDKIPTMLVQNTCQQVGHWQSSDLENETLMIKLDSCSKYEDD